MLAAIARIALLVALCLGAVTPALAEDTGRLLDYPAVAAAGLPEQHITIWLPPGYDVGTARYPVLYMHDGQNLFTPSSAVFGKVWAADKAMLAAHVPPHIIVGIWAPGAARWRQYLPADIHAQASPALRAQMAALANGPIVSDAYLAWLTGPLKTWVDASFRTMPDRDHTAIAGSSMGGLISCAAFLHYPAVYGRAACISSHWPAVDPRAVGPANPELIGLWDRWFAAHLGAPDGRRLWLDHGTATLDAFYDPYQQAVDRRIAAQGWVQGRDWQTRVYPGAAHEENSWGTRLPEIFGWLLQE